MENRRPHIFYTDGELTIRGIKLSDIASAYGTPLYITDLDRVIERYEEIASSFKGVKINIAYAYKANSLLAITRALAMRGSGATVVSSYGIKIAMISGVENSKIVLDGPSKSDDDINEAISSEIALINVESRDELDVINKIASRHGKKAKIGIRVNLGLKAGAHPKIMTGGREHKFGVSEREAAKLFILAAKMESVKPVALHSHIGSQINNLDVFKEEAAKLASIASKINKKGFEVPVLDLGGGLGVPYGEEKAISYREFASAVIDVIKRAYEEEGMNMPELVIEPGRYIVADSTVLLMRVNYVKKLGRKKWILVDAGMNDFIRPAMYGARHEIAPVKPREGNEIYSIGGPVCESSDVFADGVKLPRVERGDLLALLDAGAYGISMASNYNIRPIPAVVVVSGGKVKLARKRDSLEHILAMEMQDSK
mgnify:CR=1 FL=1